MLGGGWLPVAPFLPYLQEKLTMRFKKEKGGGIKERKRKNYERRGH